MVTLTTQDITMDLEQRLAFASGLRKEGYNCAQCVIMAFPDVTGFDDKCAAAVTACMGRGLGGSGLTCGALLGALAVEGIAIGGDPERKKEAGFRSAAAVERFRQLNGAINCGELRVPGAKPCMDLILDSVRMIYDKIGEGV